MSTEEIDQQSELESLAESAIDHQVKIKIAESQPSKSEVRSNRTPNIGEEARYSMGEGRIEDEIDSKK